LERSLAVVDETVPAKFREPILKFSAQKTRMNKILVEMTKGIQDNGRYGFVNYCKTTFQSKEEDAVSKIHLEARFPDNVLSPSAATAFGVLVYALFIKAVLLSQYGTLYSGSKEYMDEANKICNALLNNNGPGDDQRTSDTSSFHLYTETVRAQAVEMVSLLEKELKEHDNAFNVLMRLAERPCSMRLCDGDSWDKIESDLSGVDSTLDTKIVSAVLEATDTAYVTDCVDLNEWALVVAEDNSIDKDKLLEHISKMEKNNTIRWDNVSGTFVRL
jgi:hypothetical protein